MQVQFLFAVLWGLCSTVPEQSRKAFDSFFRNLIDGLVKGSAKPPSFKLGRSNLFGEQGTVFEYMINPEAAGTWCRWEEQISLVTVSSSQLLTWHRSLVCLYPMNLILINYQVSQSGEGLVVPTSETLKQEFFLKLAIKHEFPLALVGPTGTGKTFLTCGLIASLSTEKFINNIVNFSARTNVNYTQDVIMSKLDRRRKGVYGPAMGKKCIIFIDDLNLPQKDESGTIPPVELLR